MDGLANCREAETGVRATQEDGESRVLSEDKDELLDKKLRSAVRRL